MSLYSWSGISANGRTDIVESHVGWSVIVPEFEGHLENDSLTAMT